MNLADMWAQLESDLDWRQEEIRLLSNSIMNLARESDRDRTRRAQLVMLYAHIEGFSKVALSTYLKAINELALKSQVAVEGIVASAFADVFHAITYGDPKRKIFKRALPQDEGLSLFSTRCEFVSQVETYLSRPLNVPERAVDTESNLNSTVLRRNLAKLGFPVDKFASYETDLDELVYRRHGIAHGIDIQPVHKEVYDRLQRAAFHFMDELTPSMVGAIENEEYLK
jgi:hypothetical protein